MTLPDESQYRLPPEWEALILPRRGRRQPVGDWYTTPQAVELAHGVLTQLIDESELVRGQWLTQLKLLTGMQQGPTEVSLATLVQIGKMLVDRHWGEAILAWTDLLVNEFGLSCALDAVRRLRQRDEHGSRFRDAGAYFRNQPMVRLRAHLAQASEPDYAQVRDRAHRLFEAGGPVQRTELCFLFCSEPWLGLGEIAHRSHIPWLLATLDSPGRLEELLRQGERFHILVSGPAPYLLPTFIHQLGGRAGELLLELEPPEEPEYLTTYAQAIGCFPRAENIEKLLSLAEEHSYLRPTLNETARRFPRTTSEVLLKLGKGSLMLERIFRRYPELQHEFLPDYEEEVQEVAPPELWPECLRESYWERALPDVELVPENQPPSFEWPWREPSYWPSLPAEEISSLEKACAEQAKMVGERGARHMGAIVFRYQIEALPALIDYAKKEPQRAIRYFAPFCSDELLRIAAALYGLCGNHQALGYLRRYPKRACRAILPLVLSPTQARREVRLELRAALRDLAQLGGARWLEEAAKAYGPEAEAAASALLGLDPEDTRLAVRRTPRLPDWFHPREFAAPVLKVGGCLGPEAVERLARLVTLAERPACLDQVLELCTHDSLFEFVWQLFETWLDLGGRRSELLCLRALAWPPGSQLVLRLTPNLRHWCRKPQGEILPALVRLLIDVGTPDSLYRALACAQQAPSDGGLQGLVLQAASDRCLTVDQLFDRFFPHFDFAANGILLDFGRRFFLLDIDEARDLVLLDMEGQRLEELPEPAGTDDAELAAQARRLYATLQVDLKEALELRIASLEKALAWQRCWSVAEFQEVVLEHPLTRRIAQSLVWEFRCPKQLSTCFRLHNDGFWDVQSESWELPAKGEIRLCHPLHLSLDERVAWYRHNLNPPFPQIPRSLFEVEMDEVLEGRILRYRSIRLEKRTVLELERRGWSWVEDHDRGALLKEWSADHLAILHAERGKHGWLCDRLVFEAPSSDYMVLEQVDKVAFSEILRDLEILK